MFVQRIEILPPGIESCVKFSSFDTRLEKCIASLSLSVRVSEKSESLPKRGPIWTTFSVKQFFVALETA